MLMAITAWTFGIFNVSMLMYFGCLIERRDAVSIKGVVVLVLAALASSLERVLRNG